ncbi:MAG TPA: NUDIX hydrolase [Candidatus Limnocylindria bacterium]|nr:NUDIX hydrolase [Candidatus Limnocylindria bacterium]
MSTTRDRARRIAPFRVRSAAAAGGVVVRDGEHGVEVALLGRTNDGSWVLPKGTPAEGETAEETALREVREETGLEVRIQVPIGSMSYSFAATGLRVHKTVHFFLMEPVGGDISLHDAEYDEVRWVRVADARRMLSFDTYRDVLDRALAARA